MQCPYCQKEMQKGYISNSKEDIRWTPEGETPGTLVNCPKPNEVQLVKWRMMRRVKLIAYRCAHCCIEIIDEKKASK